LRQALVNVDLVLILLVALVAQFGLGMLQSTFALFGEAVLFKGYSDEATNLGIGLLLATVGIGQFITQAVLIRPLVRRFGESRLVVFGNVIRALGLVSFAVSSSPWIAAIGGLMFAIGSGLTNPPLQTLATRAVTPDQRGSVLGIVQSSISLATIVSTAIAGLIFAFNPTAPFLAGAGLTTLALIPALVLVRRFRNGVHARPPQDVPVER
jgi:DHA1 family multidrug resistance protein-like MFS transporter